MVWYYQQDSLPILFLKWERRRVFPTLEVMTLAAHNDCPVWFSSRKTFVLVLLCCCGLWCHCRFTLFYHSSSLFFVFLRLIWSLFLFGLKKSERKDTALFINHEVRDAIYYVCLLFIRTPLGWFIFLDSKEGTYLYRSPASHERKVNFMAECWSTPSGGAYL